MEALFAAFARGWPRSLDLGGYLPTKRGMVFSDILTLPDRLGSGVTFEPLSSGETP